jgi:hypothetical protein
LLDKIYGYITSSERNVFMFVEIFERFKDELLARTNINNRYFLQGVLKYKFSSDFYYTRDTIFQR